MDIEISETASDGRVSEGMKSDSDLDFSSPDLTGRFDNFDRWQAQIGLKQFGENLQAAASAVFPPVPPRSYNKIYVLMLSWEDEDFDHPISPDLTGLFKTFKNVYHFDVEHWRIPIVGCHVETNQRILDFVRLGGDSEEDLKIVFYAGQSKLIKNGSIAWIRSSDSRYPAVQWSGIQNTLEQALSDVLVLLDCPHSGSSNNDGSGNTELIAASNYNATSKEEAPFTFTQDLELELRELSKLPTFSIGNLYHNIFCRMQGRIAEDQEFRPPIYLPLSQENTLLPRSIRLAAHKRGSWDVPTLPSRLTSEDSFEVQPPTTTFSHDGGESDSSFQTSSAILAGHEPHMAFAIRIGDGFNMEDLSSDLFLDWVRNMPGSEEVKIEAAFHSNAALLIVSVPICMSIYLPQDPAIINLGPITSINQVLNRVPVPRDLPTPNPDSHQWDNHSDGSDRSHTNSRLHEHTPGFNGTHKTSEMRFRKQVKMDLPPKVTRPSLDTGFSSQFSISSSITEEPAELNGFSHANTINVPETKSHPIPSLGPHGHEASGPQSKAHAKRHTYTDEPGSDKFPRISKPVELLRNSYDCVVIGSGYGGGVAASRMARAGQSVCLLERGKERWPGEYPSGFLDAMKQLHVSGEFAPGFLRGSMVEGGDPTGMYHLIVGKGQNAFVGNGLGGTSLLNANVFLEADDKTMKMECWPDELKGYDKLKKYYKRAADVLQPEEYPRDWPDLPKLSTLEKQAEALGMHEKFKRVPQTTRFVGGPNSTGVEMYPSALTGMDSTGVNDGSKSSTLVNYLSDAWNWGAEMFCECEVRYIKKHPDPEEEGYLVFFAWHGSKRGAFQKNLYEDLMWVHAKKCVFLGAGSIGTTEILLRSKKLGLSMSDKVGQNMSGNGDILAFGYNCDEEVNAIGRQYPSPYKPIGPTITGVIDCRHDVDNPLDGFVIEEGAIPKALAPLFQTMLELMPGNQYPKGNGLYDKVKHALAQTGSRFLGPYFSKGSIEKTQVYLIMSHDSNQALLTLKDDKPVLEFLGVGNSGHVKYLNGLLQQATEAVGGTFVQSPFYACLGQQEITVHPIGGACMSKDGTADHGVTNHFGEVLTGHGTETHPGLVVTDAAVIPTALGVNPFATITALAERSVEHAARDIGRRIDLKTKNDILDLFAEPHQYAASARQLDRQDTVRISDATDLVAKTQAAKKNGFGFSEVMSGYIHVGDGIQGDKIEDYETAAKTARGLCEEARFFLSVQAFDTEMTVNRADHRAMLTGTFTCAGLKGSPFLVQRGNFHLFSVDQKAPGTKNLTYDFDMTSVDGTQFHFHGYKVVDSSVALGPWKFWTAASTLYVTISHADGDKAVLGRGMMHIAPSDFLSEIFTLNPSGRNLWAKIQSTASFMGYFARQSASLFLAPLVYQQYPATFLYIWEPRNPSIATKNLFMVPGASVDHQIFALPTIEVNAVNYFTRAGYRVFVTVHRICQLMVAENNWTTFDARLDIKACLEYIRAEYGEEKIYTIAHCMGAVAFSCGLLDGTIPADWILGISCSQVFFNPVWSTLNMAKVLAGPVPFDKLYKMLGGSWFSCSSSTDDSYFQQMLNQVLRFYPDERKEICNNVSCHRCSLIFGRLWNHRNLNESTHRQINRFFGGVNMTLLHTLMQQGHRGFVTTNGPLFTPLTTHHNINRLKGIPIMLFSGSDNKVLTPEATERTYSILRDTFGTKGYERKVIQGYGHLDCWMGREAYKDVFPEVREVVDLVTRGERYKYREPDWKADWGNWKHLERSG
ncbi:hypothetical protein B0J14DRAFT_646000 [Halenospora varia]|nr:hypothetical protein B0J14DRAFT_646000 [Halenospora varia]